MSLTPIRSHSGELLRLDLLRFIASAGIVWHHSHEFFHPQTERALIGARSQAMALFVDLFFIISGFVIAYVYSDRIDTWQKFGRFLQRRIGRLVPIHWMTLLIAWCFWMIMESLHLGNSHVIDLSVACVAQTALLVHALMPCAGGVSPNGQSWSVSTEMALYLLFPFMCLFLRWRMLLPIIVIATLALGVIYASQEGQQWDKIYPILRGIPAFLFGMTLFQFRERLALLKLNSSPMLVSVAVMIFLMNIGVSQYLVLTSVFVVSVLAVAADMHAPAEGIVARLAPLGQLTYSIYMWHGLLIVVFMNALGDKFLHLSFFSMMALALFCYIAIVVVSYLSWAIIEMPARRWIDSL